MKQDLAMHEAKWSLEGGQLQRRREPAHGGPIEVRCRRQIELNEDGIDKVKRNFNGQDINESTSSEAKWSLEGVESSHEPSHGGPMEVRCRRPHRFNEDDIDKGRARRQKA